MVRVIPPDGSLVPSGPSVEEAVYRAHLGYVSDAQKRSLEHWYGECAADQIGWSSFRRRASLGNWTEERIAFWTEVSGQVLAERAGALAAAQVRELADLETARQSLLGELTKMQVKARSLEGVVAALVTLDRRADEKRQAILDRLDRLTPTEARVEKPCSFSAEELRAMTRAVLQLRLQQQQEAAQAPTSD